MFTGKGGVGKTTLAAASALEYAAAGPTLLISTDPSGSLGEIFGCDLTKEPVTVAAGLEVVELTRELILKLWREKFADEIYTVLAAFLPVGREILDYIEGAPGIDEEFMLDFLLTRAQSGRYRTIVWDTAPTAATLNLLFVQQLFYSHLTQAQKVYLKVKSVFSQVDPLRLIQRWLELTRAIIVLLRTRTRARIVANPERLPVEQALVIAAALEGFEIPVAGFILNRLLPLEAAAGHPFWERRYELQQRWRQRLREAGPGPIQELEELSGDLGSRAGLERIRGVLFSS